METVAVNKRTRIFLIKNGKFLVMIRKFTDNNALLLPGGGVEGRETFEQAIAREVQEELSYSLLTKPKLIDVFVNERAPHPNEMKKYDGATLIRDEYHFYQHQLSFSDQIEVSAAEKHKFLAIAFVLPSEIQALAKQYNANIGLGIEQAAGKLM